MKSLMSFVFLMPMMISAAPSRAESRPAVIEERCGPDAYCLPRPFPEPRYCPEGTHRLFDEYSGRYICVPNDERSPRPRPWHDERMKKMSGILGGDDMSAKGAALNGLFDAAQLRATGAGAVSAGAWGKTPSGTHGLKPYEPRKGKSGLVLVGEKGAAAGAIVGGVATGGHVVGEALGGLAGSKAEDKFNSGVDKLGDKLRDRNDEKLRQGTQAQKDAEKKWPKK